MNSRHSASAEKDRAIYRSRGDTMTTQVMTTSHPAIIQTAAAVVHNGDLIVIPTDTVYGLAASFLDGQAINRLFEVKHRDREKGIPILIADLSDLEKIARKIPPLAEEAMTSHWPGPLTLVLPKRRDLLAALSNTDSIAVRMPDHEIAREIIRACGGALAATSANLSGHPPAQTAGEAVLQLAGSVSLVVDGGPSFGQTASTVVDCTGEQLRVLRLGPLTMGDLHLGERL